MGLLGLGPSQSTWSLRGSGPLQASVLLRVRIEFARDNIEAADSFEGSPGEEVFWAAVRGGGNGGQASLTRTEEVVLVLGGPCKWAPYSLSPTNPSVKSPLLTSALV